MQHPLNVIITLRNSPPIMLIEYIFPKISKTDKKDQCCPVCPDGHGFDLPSFGQVVGLVDVDLFSCLSLRSLQFLLVGQFLVISQHCGDMFFVEM